MTCCDKDLTLITILCFLSLPPPNRVIIILKKVNDVNTDPKHTKLRICHHYMSSLVEHCFS